MSDSLSRTSEVTDSTAVTSCDQSTGTSLPLMMVSAYQDDQLRHTVQTLPELPSFRYKYSVWHELSETHVTGNQLKAPRVRDGPEEKELLFYRLRDDTNRRIHHARTGKERLDYRDQTENWEQAVVCNLSFQELQHSYQKDNFIRVLKRLQKVQHLTLLEDNLVNLSSVSLPCVQFLNLTKNHIKSLKKLPKMPQIKHLVLTDNVVKDLSGLEYFKKTPLEFLELRGNPVAFSLNYRNRVFSILTGLKLLDGIARQPADDVVHPEPEGDWDREEGESSSCVIT